MKKLFFAVATITLFLPALALAQSAFDGTWKVDLSKVQAPSKPISISLKNGMYHCNCSTPPINVKADGQFHSVSGHPGYDMVAVKVVDDHSVQETDKKAGKVVATDTSTVSADGKTMTDEFTDYSGTAPVSGKITSERVSRAPAGGHAIAGKWRIKDYNHISDSGLTFTYKVDGDTVTESSPTGDSWTAKINGPAAPYHGNPAISTVTLKKMGKNGLQRTYRHDGKIISVADMTVSSDGKTMKGVLHNKQQGTTMTMVADKQ